MSILKQEETFLGDLHDGQLAQQVIKGDERAFETLVKRYSSSLFHFIYHLLGDYDDSCDVLQRVMVQLYKSLPTLEQGKSFKPWLFKVAHNRAIDELRSRRCIHFSELELADGGEAELLALIDPTPLPQETLESHEVQRRLRRAIEDLPIHYRSIVLLHYLSQCTFSEIGRIIDKPESTVKTYFHRAKPLLRQYLQAEHVYELLPER
jgi:RNA polymerase sigma-70 factor (ECF subfamily)